MFNESYKDIFEVDESTLLNGVENYLGYIEKENKILFNWELFFIKAYKS